MAVFFRGKFMSKIVRYAGNLLAFGSNAQGLERTIFGETTQADDLTSQITTAFLRGWGIVGPSENPSLEDFNAAMYTVSQFIAYQHQMGVPEWHAEQEYYVGSICTLNGESYQSLENNNVGNTPPSAKWTSVLTAKNGIANLGLKEAAKRDVGTGTNQIPDMSAFTYGGNWFKLPSGWIVQSMSLSLPANTTSGNAALPVIFPGKTVAAVATGTSATGFETDPGNITLNLADNYRIPWRRYNATAASTITIIAMGY